MTDSTDTIERQDDDTLDHPVTTTQLSGTPKTDEERRAALRARIEASKERQDERTFGDTVKDAGETVKELAREHPLATVAGVLGLGLVIGAMTRPGRRAARRGGLLARAATDAALAFGMTAVDKVGTETAAARRAGSDGLQDFGETLGSTLRSLRRDAAYRSDVLSDSVRSGSRKASRRASRSVRDLRSRLTH